MTGKKNVIFFIIILFICQPSASADVIPEDIAQAIRKDLEHPYLYFTAEEKTAICERIQNDPDCRDIMQRLLAEANRLLHTPVDPTPPARVRNARYNATYDYERYADTNSTSAYNLAFVYQITGDEKYARKAFEFADVVCDLPTWVHGAHEFHQIYGRVWPWGAKDDQVVFSYAQHSDYAVFNLASVYDWLYPALNKRRRDRIRGALLEKAILRVRGNYEYHWWASAYRCNWCTVCNSSIGVASIALLTEDPHLTDVIAESYNRISKTLDEIRDGGWQEGLGYLIYAVRTSLAFADVLNRATGGRYNLNEHPRFDDSVRTFLYCQIPPDKSVHFGDSGGGRIGSYNMYNRLMLETGNRQAAWLRKHLTDERPSGLTDLFMPRSFLEPELPHETSIYFPAVEWVIMRSDFTDPENVVIACKSGKHDDPHHGHLDSGHFSLYWRGREFICDHGSAGYDRKYFDEERWNYPLASSIGHNVVLVNGEKQLPGKLKNRSCNFDIGGEICEFRPGSDRDYVIMDPTNAYPQKNLKSWRRHIILDKPFITVVLDEVVCEKGAEIEVRFHSKSACDIKEDHVLLKSDEGIMALIPVVDGQFTVRPGKHTILMAQKNAKLRWVPYFGTVVKTQSENIIIAAIILPVKNEHEAETVVKSTRRSVDFSGSLTMSFTRDGKTYSYTYSKTHDGLVLK